MAVNGMKKLSVVTLREETDGLLYALQRLRCVELQTETAESPVTADSSRLSAAIGQAEEAADFLAEYRVKAGGLFASPVELDWDQSWPEGETLAEKAAALSRRMTEIRSALTAVRVNREGLLPWKAYTRDLPGSRTKYTNTICGLLPAAANMEGLGAALAEYACVTEEIPRIEPEADMGRNAKNSTEHALAVTMWHSDTDAVSSILNGYGFLSVQYRAESA